MPAGTMAKAFAELMRGLGYERYGAHGSDWGSRVARELSLLDAEHVFGIHVVMMLSSMLPQDKSELQHLSGEEQRRVQRQEHFRTDQMGYGMIQSTRPQTLAYGLTDSPVAQLSWIVEKFKEFTDSKGLPEDAVDVFPRDISIAIRRFAERGNNIVHWSESDRGGHFPAMEESDLLIGDLRTFFRRFR
ncbi:MAG: alpha/beta fold hydrolase [Gemmatimonadales bacterium]